jgi:hypothetical protein
MYITDATFDTNDLRLPLLNIVSIDNTNKTFPLAQAFITTESAVSFRFIQDMLSKYVFYNYPEPTVIVRDFAKGLAKAVALKAAEDAAKKRAKAPNETRGSRQEVEAEQDIDDKDVDKGGEDDEGGKDDEVNTDIYSIQIPSAWIARESEFNKQLDDANSQATLDCIIVDVPRAKETDIKNIEHVVVSSNGQETRLQYCTWHVASAIKRRLIHRGYTKAKREKIVTYLWQWIQAETQESLDKARRKFSNSLRPAERQYIKGFYLPKEPTFVHRYTREYCNLRVYSSQRGESYHWYSGKNLHKNLLLATAIETICDTLDALAKSYDARINL